VKVSRWRSRRRVWFAVPAAKGVSPVMLGDGCFVVRTVLGACEKVQGGWESEAVPPSFRWFVLPVERR